MSGQTKGNGRWIGLVLAVVVLIIVCLAAAAPFMGKDDPRPPAAGGDAPAVEEAVEEGVATEEEPTSAGATDPQPPATEPEQGPEQAVDPANQLNPQQMPDSSFLYDTSIGSLMTADSYMNGQTVQVIGEVVGDRLRVEGEPDFCWLCLQATDRTSGEISVYLSRTLTQLVDTYGAYGRNGTTLQVRGTFNLACDDHEGLTDLHADHVSVVRKGSVVPDELHPGAFVPGLVLALVGGVLLIAYWRMREGNR